MKKCKIEVLKTTFHDDLAQQYICNCNNGIRPVIFKVGRTAEESIIDYEPIK